MRLDPLPRRLPTRHRRWILLNAVAVTGVINLAVSAATTWLSIIGRSDVPLWATPVTGGPSTITDTVGTLFVLPFITCLLVTTSVWRERQRGNLTPLQGAQNAHPALASLPRSKTLRGITFGALCVATLAPAAVAILVATDFGHLPVADFVLYKAILGVTLGAVVTPVIALCAMADDLAAP